MNQKIKLYLVLFFACFSVRFISLTFNFPPADFDPNVSYHWLLSGDLLRYGTLSIQGIKTAAFEPLYPSWLAAARWLTGNDLYAVLVLQILVAVIGCFYFYELSFLLSKNRRVSFIASLIYCLYPYLIYQTTALKEVTLFTTLLIAAAYYYVKASDVKNTVFSGFFFGLTILTRSASLPILILGFCALIVKKGYRQGLVLLGSSLLILSPMTLRNHHLNGSWFPTRSGGNLFDGNSEYSDKLIPAFSMDLLAPYVDQTLKKEDPQAIGNQKEMNRFFKRKAIEFMAAHPVRTVKLKLLNLVYFFYPRIVPFHPMDANTKFLWDENGNYRIINPAHRSLAKELAYSIPYTFILITAAMGIYLRRKLYREDLILYFILFSFAAIYSLYFPSTQYRCPMDFVFMFFSAFAIDYGLNRFEASRWPAEHSV